MKYTIFYMYFYLFGKYAIEKIFSFTKEEKNNYLLFTKIEYLSPLFGLLVLGNVLILINFFVPLGNNVLAIILLLLPLFTLKTFKIEIKKIKKFDFIFNYLFIPGLLLVSALDITFHYDAGYYHILHQSWLRDSEAIIGMVNIFFAFGMSSIYEYLSAILWFDNSFIFLHFINIYFFHLFYLVIKDYLIRKKYNDLYNIALVVLIYSLLDNFGIGGGRNGFPFIQNVTKQDTTVGILFWFIAIVLLKKIKEKDITKSEIVFLSLLCFFVYEIKVSGVLIFILYFLFIVSIFQGNIFKIRDYIYLHLPVLVIGAIWFIKSIFTTGCLVYPVDLTCVSSFDWYISGSTAEVETYTKLTSRSYIFGTPFGDWIASVVKNTFEARVQIFSNFIGSLLIIIILKYILFSRQKNKLVTHFTSVGFVFLNFLYLLFYGPLPRYAIGVCLLTVSLIGFLSGKSKVKVNTYFIYFLIFISVFFVVRLQSYEALLFNNEIFLDDPRTNVRINENIGYEKSIGNWVRPSEGDQCWANLNCTMSSQDIIIIDDGVFKVAYRK